MPRFKKIHFYAAETPDADALSAPLTLGRMTRRVGRSLSESEPAIASSVRSMNDEHASRLYLQSFLEGMDDPSLLAVTSPDRPELVPSFVFRESKEERLSDTRTVEFQQTEKTIPIFGTRAVVEIDTEEKTLIAIDANLTELPDISPLATLSALEALAHLARFGNRNADEITLDVPPELVFFADEEADKWRLAYHFKNVPMFPPKDPDPLPETLSPEIIERHRQCFRTSPRHASPQHDFLVDGHSGEVFFYFSSSPRLDIPTECSGIDDESAHREFDGLQISGGFWLSDPLRNIQTYDYGLGDLDANPAPAFPQQPVTSPTADFASLNKPAVSAHVNASLVFDFYNDELKRNGIDDKGMALESAVNVYASGQNPNPAPDWGNAVWWQGRMWYGQEHDANGNLISFARYLDIIGHELTHGVTETTSDLVYRRLSGALNESFSDIFGIFIKNWFPGRPNPIAGWVWEMGPGLGQGGGPIRNFADPKLAGQPDHFRDYVKLSLNIDNGGVHIYSGIHNRAAYNVLMAKDSTNSLIFTPVEVAVLYYLTLTRLTRLSDFSDCRRTLLNVTGTRYAGAPQERQAKQQAIREAYDAVGIV